MKTYDTAGPAKLDVEIQSGTILVQADADVADTVSLELSGPAADRVTIEQIHDQLIIKGPRSTGLFSRAEVHVVATVPVGSQLRTRTGSADLETRGPLLAVWAHTGSGEIVLDAVTGRLQVKTGSGDVRVRNATAEVVATTGSGDLSFTDAAGDLGLKTGSGDIVIGRIGTGRVECRAGSGDLRIGIPAATPVWTDITTGSGALRSDLRGMGEPAAGQDHVRIKARTGSGDVTLVSA